MFQEIMDGFQGEILEFRPYGRIGERKAWDAMDLEWKEGTVGLGMEYLGHEFPWLSPAQYMDFGRTGNRSRFEANYFEKRRALGSLTLAECAENKGRFLDDIVNGVFSICEESGWQLPAHNTYVRDAPQLPLPDAKSPVLDLFACETAAVLATVFYLMKEKLDGVCPLICKRIGQELQERVFAPYLNKHFWWMGNGEEPLNNWTIWCTQNVLLAAFLTDTDKGLQRRILEKACRSADYFLAEYGEDGCCDEGAQYYRHAGLCLFQTLETANAVTGGAFGKLYAEEKIKNIASYILNVHVADEYYVNFADCSPIAGRAGVREFLFGERSGNGEMMRFAAQEFMAGGRDSLLLPEENNLFYRLGNGANAARIRDYAKRHPEPARHPDIYYPSTGLFLARDKRACLAVKAGGNADSHNHNDTGSFTVYLDGKPFLIDVGVESYTKKTFSPQRYEIWTMQSSYHNLPSIHGAMQAAGDNYCAKDVRWELKEDACRIEMELAGAYPREAKTLSYRREASLTKGHEICIRDRFRLLEAGDIVLSLMTYERPALLAHDDKGFSLQIGTLGQLHAAGGIFLRIEEIPILDPRLAKTWKHPIYRTLAKVSEDYLEIAIPIE